MQDHYLFRLEKNGIISKYVTYENISKYIESSEVNTIISDIEENSMMIVHSGYELNKYYEPEHVFDQSDFVYVIPIKDASRFIMEVYRFEKPDYHKYIGKEIFDYSYEEFMESYRKEVLERA